MLVWHRPGTQIAGGSAISTYAGDACDELLKDLIRQQAAAGRQTQGLESTVEQSLSDQFIDYRRELLNFRAERPAKLIQIDSAIQPQPQEEALFQSLRDCHRRGI